MIMKFFVCRNVPRVTEFLSIRMFSIEIDDFFNNIIIGTVKARDKHSSNDEDKGHAIYIASEYYYSNVNKFISDGFLNDAYCILDIVYYALYIRNVVSEFVLVYTCPDELPKTKS